MISNFLKKYPKEEKKNHPHKWLLICTISLAIFFCHPATVLSPGLTANEDILHPSIIHAGRKFHSAKWDGFIDEQKTKNTYPHCVNLFFLKKNSPKQK